MAYTIIHTKKNGVKCVYSVEGYWDKEKKAARKKQVCLGRLDEKTGEVIPSGRKGRAAKRAAVAPEVTATTKVIGPGIILDKIASDIKLTNILKICFPDWYQYILSLTFFMVQKGLPLSRCEAWSKSNRHPVDSTISSQRVSELLLAINDDGRQAFFSRWMKTLIEKECLFYDITSVSSYSEQNAYVRWGHNRDTEKLPQVNLAMLFGQSNGLPAYFRRLPGTIPDVAALRNTLSSLDFLGQVKLCFVLDRGFYSQANLDALFEARCQFIIACPRRKWVEERYDLHREGILDYHNRQVTGENETLYMTTHLHKWKGRRCYLHLYFNNFRAAEELDAFSYRLAVWEQEIKTDRLKPENEWAYQRYFTVKNTPVRGKCVIENKDAVEADKKRYIGFFCLLTTGKMDAKDALAAYRAKEAVENCFDDIKNQLDMKRLRTQSAEAMDSRLFIQFLALILLSKLRSLSKQDDTIRNLTIREIMEHMEAVTEIRFSGRYGKVVAEADRLQRKIMDCFGVSVET